MTRIPTRRLLAAAVVLIALGLVFLWAVPSPDYLFLPNRAQPLASHVTVQDGKPPDSRGGIYYLDVTIRKASWLERLFAPARPDGATLVSHDQYIPKGSSFEERRREGQAEMDRSERIAAAVALREAGYKVRTTPRGALVEAVAPDVPAAARLKSGDVIVAVDGSQVRTPAALRKLVSKHRPGDVIGLRIRRGGSIRDVPVKTVPTPGDPSRSIIGISVSPAADIALPLKVAIDLGEVGGPSAGLPFALQVLEDLGRDVDRGYRVAATGEIELDGSVAPIGGVKQKARGAREAKVDVLLVPAGENAAVARRYGGNVRVIPVESFQQALQKLATLPPKS